jgi:hypothetical protein
LAKGTRIRRVLDDVQAQQRLQGDTKVDLAAAPIRKDGNADEIALITVDCIDRFPNAASRRQDIVHDQSAFAGGNHKPAAQNPLLRRIIPFGENPAGP